MPKRTTVSGGKGKGEHHKKHKTLTVARMPEMKHFDASLGGWGSISTTWTEIDFLAYIQQGQDYNARIGRQIDLQSITMKGTLHGGAIGTGGADDYYNGFRLTVYTHAGGKSGTGLTPLGTAGIVQSQKIDAGNVPGLLKILKDEYIGFTNRPYGAGLCAADHHEINFYHRFNPPLRVNYAGTGLNWDQIGLYLACISDSTGVPNPGFTMGYWAIRYTDV